MGIDFKKLIPSNVRTGRWGELIEVIQSVFEEIKADKIDIIKTQFELDNMTSDQILDLAKFFGYDINYRDGLTSTLRYLRKEILSIVPRILNRTTSIAYDYIFNCYDFTGNVYPCIRNDDGVYLEPFMSWESSNEIDTPIYLDPEADNILFYNAGSPIYGTPSTTGLPATFLDPTGDTTPTTLDENATLSTITRHILVSYEFNYIENEDEFISFNSIEAFYSDLWYNKRRTEILHLEPKISIETNSGSMSTNSYTDYDETLSGFMYGKHQLGNFSSGWVDTIQFGNGSHGSYSTISGTILTGVESLVSTYTASDFQIISQGVGRYNARPKITDTNKMETFTEFAILSTANGLIYYSQLPEINYSSKFNSSIQLDITLV